MAERKVLPCLALAEGEIAPRVITCGDPARAERIAGMLDNSKCLAKNREFWTFTGEYKGVPVTVSSHGVGCGGDCAHCSQNCSRRPPDEHPKP